MQCVIICAGKGTRMLPLTEHIPKPLIKICGTPLIEHVVAVLPEEVTELILVVGYLGEQIKEHCGSEYLGRKVTYVEQEDYCGGTGDALISAKAELSGRFPFMYADDIHGAAALKEAVRHPQAILAAYSDEPQNFGVLVEDDKGGLIEIVEKPEKPPTNKVNIGGLVLDKSIFDYKVDVSHEHGELFVTDMVTAYAKENFVQIVMQDMWIPVGRPEDIAKAEQILCPKSH